MSRQSPSPRMGAQRWQRIAAIFDAVVELDGAAREPLLDQLCAGDSDLRADVERLLQSDAAIEEDGADPIDGPRAAHADWIASAATTPVPVGLMIGAWRVLREIGRGGMGVVYLAERADGQYEQHAAIKLMHTCVDQYGLRRRFLRERQILARLEHPNITRLLDGGVTAAGEPWFAIEYIDGELLLEHIASSHADLASRLRLFLEICAAVQFAHRQLIVHCDIKPSNVLVDREGRVKLLDFGIASALGHATASAAETQLRALTPAYASPEQLRGDPVTTLSDVFALGAVLHEMLTGVRAYRVDARASSQDRLAAISDPRRALPSSAVTARKADDGSEDAATCSALPARLLRGDLDVITATALQAEPERRYATVAAFADDIRRHLEGTPIAARATSTPYRIGKFIGRHRIAVAISAIAVLALVAALGTALLQARNAREQAEQARAAARVAMQQSERAEGVRRILVGVFEQAEPDANQGRPINAHELLEMGERQIEGAIASEPAVEADAATLISELYVKIGDFTRAEALLQRALAFSEDPRVPDDVKARVLVGIAFVEEENNAYDDAVAHAERGLALLEESDSGSAVTVAKAHSVIAYALTSQSKLTEAEAVLRESLRRDGLALGEQSEAVAGTWIQLGNVLGARNRLDEAEQAFRTGIAILRSLFGQDSYHVAHALNELSSVLSDKNDFAGAEKALEQSLQIRLRTYGEDNRDTLIVRHNLLVLMETQGRVAEALPQRLAIIERVKPNGNLHPRDLASYYLATGRDQRDLGQFDAAASMLRRAIQAFDETLGPTSMSTVSSWRSLGTTLTFAGRYDEAERVLRKALEIQMQSAETDPLGVALARTDLGNLLRLRHQEDAALALLQPAAAAFDEPSLSGSSGRPAGLSALSETQLDAGNPGAALTTATAALESGRANLPPRHYLLAAPLFALARVELALGHAKVAEPLLREALEVRQATHPGGDPRVLEVQVALIAVLHATHRDDEAATLRAEVEPRLRTLHSPYATDLRTRLRASVARS